MKKIQFIVPRQSCKSLDTSDFIKNKNISKDEFTKHLETLGLNLYEYQIELLYNMYIYENYNTNIHVNKYKK